MSATNDGNKKPSRPTKKRGKAVAEKKSRAEMIELLLQRIESEVDANQLKVTVADFVKLVQLQREMSEEQPKEIEVRWVDGSGTEDASKK